MVTTKTWPPSHTKISESIDVEDLEKILKADSTDKPWSLTKSAEEKAKAEQEARERAQREAKAALVRFELERSEKEAKELIKLLEQQKQYLTILPSRTDVSEEYKGLIPRIDNSYYFQQLTEDVCYHISGGRATLLIGHTGTGKTSMIEQIACRKDQPTIRANMNGQTSISDFVGFWGVHGNQTYWVDGVLPFAMKNNIWLIVDELDMADAPILSVLNALLEKGGKLVLKEKGHEVVHPGPNFRLIATANAVGCMSKFRPLYQGTNIMNEAFLDRFKCHIVDYMPETLETQVLTSAYPELPKELARKLVDLANHVRKAFIQETVQCTFSTRRLLDWAEDIVHYRASKVKKPIMRAAQSNVFSKISTEDSVAIEGFIKRLFGPEDTYAEPTISFHDGEATPAEPVKKKLSFKDM